MNEFSRVIGMRSVRVFSLCVLEENFMNEELDGRAELK